MSEQYFACEVAHYINGDYVETLRERWYQCTDENAAKSCAKIQALELSLEHLAYVHSIEERPVTKDSLADYYVIRLCAGNEMWRVHASVWNSKKCVEDMTQW